MIKKSVKSLLFALTVTCLVASSGFASTGDLGLSVEAGSLGAGVKGTVGLTENINLRGGVNAFNVDFDFEASNIDFEAEIDMLSFPVILDWHPFEKSGFRVSAGMLINKNEADIKADVEASYHIGGNTYTTTELGTLTGEVEFNEVAPYVGIGWGNAISKDGRWSFTCDLGVVFQGSPDIDLKANGTMASDATFQANLAREKKKIEDKLDNLEYYPVISVGIAYRF